ncbi:HpcH/HpaI aldolase/citrate lyase family protein [Zhihengliuella salsuginis]|uniref:CoA ester lyase n=1 Tax=Zhihengliuella salsuginis TaxID=578222 RepID=A0ABQ3GHT6_9MICC|nr:CoA ester lyase [Zhihengliuella salsuginis]GHD07611.1 CoA ester lyase [Zhihengliuella salsuginis]
MSSEFGLGPAILFCPADRPERYTKALERADAVIVDLEDAVLPDARTAAREHVVAAALDPERAILRVNPVGTADFAADVRALEASGLRHVMLAKTETPEQVRELAGYRVIALIETALGVVNAAAIATEENVVALMWGAEDLISSLGGTSSRRPVRGESVDDDGGPRLGGYRSVPAQARAQVRLAAGAFGKAAIDSVYLDLADHGGLAAEVEDAVAQGFAATACIHPGQAEVIRAGYRPSAEQLEWARALLAEAAKSAGAFGFRGEMVDEVVLKRARLIVGRGA